MILHKLNKLEKVYPKLLKKKKYFLVVIIYE